MSQTDMMIGGAPWGADRTRDVMLIGKAMANGRDLFLVNDKTGNLIDIVPSETEAWHIAQHGNRGHGYSEARIYKRTGVGHLHLLGVSKRTNPHPRTHIKVA
jgi:hypothetical protein